MTSTYELVEAPTLRVLYDPSGQHKAVPDDVFYGTLAGMRPEAELHGFGTIHGNEVAFADSIHLMAPPPRAVINGVDPTRVVDIRQAIQLETRRTVGCLAVIAERHSIDGNQYADTFPDGKGDKALLAIRGLAMNAHDGIMRRNGKEYITHTEGTASVLEAAWWRHNEKNPASYQVLRLRKALAYVHDAPEDTIDPWGDYLGLKTIASPRVIYQTLGYYGLSGKAALGVARATLLLDNSKGITGQKMPNVEYIDRMLESDDDKDPMAGVAKMADMCNNGRLDVEDVRQPGVRSRIVKYRSNEERILAYARQHYPRRHVVVMESIPSVTQAEMDVYYDALRPLTLKPHELNDRQTHPARQREFTF